jgi:glutathione synthase/RimK-type ligase-like ATP-grasp enzyme
MNIIISKRTSKKTIGEVLSYMDNPPSSIWYRLSRHDFTEPPPDEADLMIRWGCSSSIRTESEIEYNKREAIQLSSNKGKCRQYLYDNGIPVPKPVLHDDIFGARYNGTFRFPIVVRPTFHQKGKNFLLFNNLFELYNGWRSVGRLDHPYISEFYPKTTEYRVHVGHGKVLVVQQKVQTSEPVGENWSHENGYTFEVVPWKQYRKEIVDLAVKTIEVLGLDFGAVDIMADPLDSSLPIAVVCEVNTSPRLEGYTAQRYAKYFDWLVNTHETRHFEIPKDLRARHYAFKNRELIDEDYDLTFK